MRKKLCLMICSILFVILSACTSNKTMPISQTGFYFDTVITITLYDSSDKTLLDSCFELADYYEHIFSKTINGSDIYRINNSNGMPTEVSPETIELLSVVLQYSELTNGIVDPTIGGVSALWDFHKQNSDSDTQGNSDTDFNTIQTPPEHSLITDAIAHTDYTNIKIHDNTVTLTDPYAHIDLGFIAKGYIADRIKDFLISEGITSAIINLGGNVLTIGSKPDSSAFNIGIQEPFAKTGTAITVVSSTDCSVVTSGIYERYFNYDNKLYHHILNTKTGYPVETDLLGVTIISDNSVDGDALSTACLALGYKPALELIESIEGIEALFITNDGEIHTTY